MYALSSVFDFTGKTVLVTGSSQNVGFTIACAFVKAGARVILHGPQAPDVEQAAERLQRLHSGATIFTLAFDLGNSEAIDGAFLRLKENGWQPDILVNNAAHLGLGDSGFLEQSPAFFREVLEVNLFGQFRCSQLAAAVMKKRRGGAIVNISSLAGERAVFGRSAYNTSKAALDGLTRSMAQELSRHGIRVNAIAPGYIWTPRWDHLENEVAARRRKNVPVGQPTAQEEIALLALFLASDAAPTMTGSNVVIDGGLNVQQVPHDIAL